MLAGVVPDPFGCLPCWPVGRAWEDFPLTAMGGEPVVGFLFFVIARVVLPAVHPVTAALESGHDHLLQQSRIGLPRKVTLLVKREETGLVPPHGSEHLGRVALPACGKGRLTPTLGPSRRPGGSLPKRSLLFEHNHRPFAWGVF
jgi:hypothetical protein